MMLWLLLSGFAAVSVWLSIWDIREHRIPDPIVLPSILVAFVIVGVATLISQELPQLWVAVGGSASFFGVFLGLAWISRGSLGGGDVKLSALIGLVLGYVGGIESLILGFAAMFIVGAVVSASLLLLKRVSLQDPVPFAPIMFVGSWTAIIVAVT